MAFHEVRKCCKGIEKLGRQLHGESANRVGKRMTTRIMSNARGKGIVRGQVECANLRACARDDDVTSAESINACQTTAFYGREYVEMVERLSDGAAGGLKAQFAEVDMRISRRRKVTIGDVAMLYGLRRGIFPRANSRRAGRPSSFRTRRGSKTLGATGIMHS